MSADWPPHLVAATLVERDGAFLCVEERIPGADGLVINQPAGHWERGETLIEAAIRETLEETAWHVEITGFLGLYAHEPEGLGYGFLRFAFLGRALRHEPQRTLDEGIERAVWLTPAALRAASDRHRSPMVMRCVEDVLSGRSLPLDTIRMLT